MNLHGCKALQRAAAVSVFAIGLLSPGSVSAATAGGAGSTGTLVGAVTCGADEITPAGNAVVSVAGLNVQTRTNSGGRFTLADVPAGQQLRIDAADDPQQSSVNSRFNVVAQPDQILDVGSIDVAVCPSPSVPTPVTTDFDMEQRGGP